MTIRTHFLAALVAVPLAFAATSASAGESVCGAEFDSLAAAISAPDSGISKKDIDGMMLKAQLAEAKLVEAKIGDSMEKLHDIQARVDQLAGAPKTKIQSWAAEDITGAVSEAGNCVYSQL